METNRLRQFKAVSELKNLRKAADVLHLSHSALSKSLKVLQKQIQKELLVQKGRNIEITEDGLALLPKIKEFLKMEEELLKSDATKSNIIKIATFEAFSTHLLCRSWKKFLPDSELELREFLPGKMEEAISQGVSSIGISYEPIPHRDIELTFIGKVEMGIFGIKEKFQNVPFQELPFVTPVSLISGTPTGAKGLDGWPENELPRTSRFRVDMMESGLTLARTGQAVIYIPKFLAQQYNHDLVAEAKLHQLPHPKGLKNVYRKVFLLNRKGSIEDTDFRRVAKLIRSQCL
ncbi:MAG: LysR family transcriptional regulator [Pseudobdellovibrionaceae bacterium]